MKIRHFTIQDYPTVCSWWKGHGWEEIPFAWLPFNGIIISDDIGPICAGFIYKTDSAMGIFEYVVSNPKSELSRKDVAMDLLIDAACLMARGLGMGVLFSAFGSKGLSKRMVRHEFKVIGTEVTNLLRRL